MIADFHNDFPTAANFKDVLEKYKKGDNTVVGAVFKGGRTFEECYLIAKHFTENKSDNLVLAYEDFTFVKSFKTLELLLDFKPFYVTCSWNGNSVNGGGAGSDNGLTPRGKDLIKLLNERNIFVDTAHLSKKSFYETLDLAEKVVCSHTAFSAVNEHKRNLDSNQLKALSERGAKVGLALYPYFLNGTAKATVDDVYRHIDYYVDLFGDDDLCIGTDFYGCECYPENMSDYSFERVLTDKLLSVGYSETTIDKILYKNLKSILLI